MDLLGWLDASLCARWALALIHFLWQGVAIALGATFAARLCRGASARYAIACGALLTMALCPLATFAMLDPAPSHDIVSGSLRNDAIAVKPSRIPEQKTSPQGSGARNPGEAFSAHSAPAPARVAAAGKWLGLRSTAWRSHARELVALYLAGVVFLLLRLALAAEGMERLRRRSWRVQDAAVLKALDRAVRAMALRGAPAISWCRKAAAPAVVGVIRPAILLPVAMAGGLSPAQLEQMLLHELAHIRRWDHLANFVQRLIEAALFFHPAVWIVSRQARIERERCCDDLVLACGIDATDYAASLVRMAELAAANIDAFDPALHGALGAKGRRTDFGRRVLRLIDGADVRPARSPAVWVAALGLVGALGLSSRANERPQQPAQPPISLQRLIDAAAPGAVVEVPRGIHHESLLVEKPLTLRGASDGSSVIEFMSDTPAVKIQHAHDVLLENLAIRWCRSASGRTSSTLAAVEARNSRVVLLRCRLEPVQRPKAAPCGLMVVGGGARATFTEGATRGFAYAIVYAGNAGGLVEKSDLRGAGHSAVTMHEGCEVRITDNILADCGADAVRNHGGSLELAGNVLMNNGRAGACLGSRPARAVISNNLFQGNAGAVWVYAGSDAIVENNLIAKSGRIAVTCQPEARLVLRRNVISENAVGIARMASMESQVDGLFLDDNIYWKNGKDAGSVGLALDPGRISVDRLFAAPEAGDFRIMAEELPSDLQGSAAGLTFPAAIQGLWSTAVLASKPAPGSKGLPRAAPARLQSFGNGAAERRIRLYICGSGAPFPGLQELAEGELTYAEALRRAGVSIEEVEAQGNQAYCIWRLRDSGQIESGELGQLRRDSLLPENAAAEVWDAPIRDSLGPALADASTNVILWIGAPGEFTKMKKAIRQAPASRGSAMRPGALPGSSSGSIPVIVAQSETPN